MSDQKKSTNQKKGSPLVFILIMLGLGFTGCNDESKTGTNTTVETTDTSGKANAGALSVGNFSILKLKKADHSKKNDQRGQGWAGNVFNLRLYAFRLHKLILVFRWLTESDHGHF